MVWRLRIYRTGSQQYNVSLVSTVTEIQEAITRLSAAEQRQLARWFEEALEDAWDNQIEEDVKAGRLNDLIAQAEADIAAGRVKPVDEVLGDR